MTQLVQKTLTMPCHTRFLSEVRTVLSNTLEEVPIDKREKDLLILAVDEAVSSLVTYAKHKGYSHEVTLSIEVDDVRFKARLVDSLNVFELNDGLNAKQLATELAKDRPYELGIFLIRRIMDEITYVYRKGFQNELEMIRFL